MCTERFIAQLQSHFEILIDLFVSHVHPARVGFFFSPPVISFSNFFFSVLYSCGGPAPLEKKFNYLVTLLIWLFEFCASLDNPQRNSACRLLSNLCTICLYLFHDFSIVFVCPV